MAQFVKTFYQELNNKKRTIRHCEDVCFTGDNLSDMIGVYLTVDGQPYTGGGTVSGTVINSRGQTIPITTGAISGNLVTVALEQSALAVPGLIGVYVKLTSGETVTTVLAAKFTVEQTETDTPIAPGTVIPSVDALITRINTAVESIPADYSELLAGVAPSFSSSTAYTAGQYVWYPGLVDDVGALYRFTADHAAGSWTGTDAAAVVLANDVADLKSAFDLPDFAKGLIVGSPTNGANSFRWFGPSGTSDITGRVGLMNEIPVSELVADRLPETDGSYHIFIQIPAYNQMAQPDDQYLPFTAVIEMEPGQSLSAGFRFGFATNVSKNTNYTVMNLARVEAGFTGGFKSKNDTYTKSYTTTNPFSWAYLNASRADLLKVRKISFVLSPVIGNTIGGLQTDVATIQNSVGGLQTDVETIQNNTRNMTEQLTDSVLFRGTDREYINGALTSPHVVEYRRKSLVADVIPSTATGTAAAFFNLAPSYRVDAVEGNYYPFTVFLHVKGGEQLSGSGVFIHYSASGISYVPNYANQISAKYTGKESGYCSVNQAFTKTYTSGGVKLQYLVIRGTAEDLRKIEYVELVLNDFAASLDKTELENQIAELDGRVETIEGEIGAKLNDYALISYGDSLTQGAGTSSWTYNYTNQCKLALGAKNAINYGYGGSASAAIAFTAGALSGYIPPNVRSFALKYADLTTDIAIALTQLNNKEVVIDGNTYTISQSGNTAYSLPSTYTPSDLWLPVRVKNSLNTADIYIIWVGTNDGEYKWDIIDAMIAKCQHKQYVVMGLTRLGTDTTVENEQIAYRKYGSHFFNTRIQVINNAFTILGMTPTAEDTTAMNSGLMPPSLLTDNTHFNDNGYTAIGKLLAKHIQSLGYSYQKAE